MIQRLLLLSAALGALFCESALGVGLGNLELNSALNQEFSAEIPITNTDSLSMEEILSDLGTQEDFDRVGVNRNFQLTDLRFKVVEKDDGSKAVRITSTRPIVEPYLNFIVEVLWPSGRILREYTVLLDPPVFRQQGVARIDPGQISRRTPEATSRPPASTVPESSATTTQTTLKTRTDLQVRTSNEVASGEGRIVDDEYGMTGRGDTLWEIAMNVRPNDSISVQQTMLALQRANPEAFINNNINLLKVGYIIRIPDRSEFQRETFSDAVAEVKIQNREFEEYKGNRVAQLDATRRSPQSGGSQRGSADDGQLKLLASDASAGQRAGDGDADARAEALEDELSIAREDLDLANRENASLNVRMKDLADQIETMTELVQVQDEQLAALRASIAQSQNAEAKTPAETETPVETETPAEINIPAETQPPSVATTPVVTTQTPPKTDLLSKALSLLSNPLVVGGLALLLIGSVVGGMIFVHRRRQASAFDDDDFAEVVLADSQPELEEEEEIEESDESEALQEEDEDDEVLAPQTGDVISEVEIYIAYGRFPQAITFLRNAIEAEPDRADIQLKLLEVYVQTEDATAFNLQLRQLKLLEDSAATAQAEELEKQLSGAADSGDDDSELDDDDDLSFDLDDLDSETDDDELDDSEGLELDIDLDLDEADEAGASAKSADADDEFELDLDLDADLDDDLAGLEEDGSEPELEDDEITLDLGDDDDDDDLTLNLDDDDDDDDDLTLNLDDDDGDDLTLSLDDDDDDALTLDLDADDDFNLEEELGLEAQDQELDGEVELSIGDDDELELDLDDVDLGSDLEEDSLDLDDLGELNLDEDASTKLDLARAYLDMGDTDGVKSLLEEVISEGSESDVKKANELMEQLD